MQCWADESRTWHVEDGTALVHGKHVGTCANVDSCILRLDVLNCQDAVKVHGPVGQFPITHAGPHQSVGWRLQMRKTHVNVICSREMVFTKWHLQTVSLARNSKSAVNHGALVPCSLQYR